MDNMKNHYSLLVIVSIGTLIVAILGCSAAWFNVALERNYKKNDVIVSNSVMSKVVFYEGDEININNINYSLEPLVSKSFSISNNDPNASENIKYSIYLEISNNELYNDLFTYSINGEINGNGKLIDNLNDIVIPNNGKHLIGSGTLIGKDSHKYNLNIYYKNSDVEDLNKRFDAKIVVKLYNEE